MEGLGKKREPRGFGDSVDGVDGFVDGALGGAKVSTEGEGAKPGAGWTSELDNISFCEDRSA